MELTPATTSENNRILPFRSKLKLLYDQRKLYHPGEIKATSQYQKEFMNFLYGRGLHFIQEANVFGIINRSGEISGPWSCDILINLVEKTSLANQHSNKSWLVIEIDEWPHVNDLFHTFRIDHCLSIANINFLRIQLPQLKSKDLAFRRSLYRMIANEFVENINAIKETKVIQPLRPLDNPISLYAKIQIKNYLNNLKIPFFENYRPKALKSMDPELSVVDFYIPGKDLAINVCPNKNLKPENLLWMIETNSQISSLMPYWPVDLFGFRCETKSNEKYVKAQLKRRIENGIDKIVYFDLNRYRSETGFFQASFQCPLLNHVIFAGHRSFWIKAR